MKKPLPPFIQKMMAAKAGAKDAPKKAMPKMAKGGCAMAKGGGIETKGKTKGKMVKMKSGGGC